ncbi:MAG: hypothetical protein H7175_10505, partial [Burkholderiales bacterium]|nr:hypothetical protein [Anaerolineae bacterium]
VLAITGGVDLFDMQQPLDLVWQMLLPAMRPDSLPDDTAAQDALAKKLSSLNLLPVQGQAASLISSQVSSRTYGVDVNELKIETIALNFTTTGCTVRLKTAVGEETIPCGYGMWQQGQTTVFNEIGLFDPMPVAASGAWTAEDTFTIVVRLYETPFFHTLVYHFVGDEMMVEIQVNVAFKPTKTLLTAHLM